MGGPPYPRSNVRSVAADVIDADKVFQTVAHIICSVIFVYLNCLPFDIYKDL